MNTPNPSHYTKWLRDKFGAGYVVAPRTTDRIRERYGVAKVITPQRYREADREYRALFGDPYDAARRQMYLALLEAAKALGLIKPPRLDTDVYPAAAAAIKETLELVQAAIQAEQERT